MSEEITPFGPNPGDNATIDESTHPSWETPAASGALPVTMTPIGYQGAAAHTWTAGCAGHHPISQPCLAAVGTGNDQFVGSRGEHVTVQAPKAVMTRAEALRHAAWLVAVADPMGDDFERVLKAVRST